MKPFGDDWDSAADSTSYQSAFASLVFLDSERRLHRSQGHMPRQGLRRLAAPRSTIDPPPPKTSACGCICCETTGLGQPKPFPLLRRRRLSRRYSRQGWFQPESADRHVSSQGPAQWVTGSRQGRMRGTGRVESRADLIAEAA